MWNVLNNLPPLAPYLIHAATSARRRLSHSLATSCSLILWSQLARLTVRRVLSWRKTGLVRRSHHFLRLRILPPHVPHSSGRAGPLLNRIFSRSSGLSRHIAHVQLHVIALNMEGAQSKHRKEVANLAVLLWAFYDVSKKEIFGSGIHFGNHVQNGFPEMPGLKTTIAAPYIFLHFRFLMPHLS